ncbi:Sec63 Brl domain-containing protein [Phlyctochytrium arcticum]|nr:Sec63 Brl domain-containing protein [Phlyctochytrium arcticum]
MAGSQYAYDETGAIFNYFLLTFLAMVLIPVTYSSLFSRNTAESVTICKCKECQQKRIRLLATKKKEQPLISVRSVVLVLGWILLTYVAYQVATTTIEEKSTFDPYALLGVDAGAAKDVIKKAWKKKVLFHHTDKNLNSTESELAAHELMTELVNKAYDTLKDPEKMAIWEEWGHPDGKQSFQLGLALPKWLVEEGNNFKVLSIYVGVFMILLPALVAQWWNKAKHMNKEKIMHPTMAKYYRELKESLGFKALLDILCKADEFYTLLSLDRADVPALERLTEQVKKAMEENTTDRWNKKPFSAKDPQTAMQQKVLLLLHSHMLRLVPDDPKLAREQLIAAEKSVQLVGGMLQIAITRSWLNIALSVVDMGQMLTQAVYFHQSPIMQLPYITADKMKYFKSKKRDVGTIRDLLELEDKERNDLLRFLEPEQTDLVVHVAKQYPMLRVTQAKFSVLGEPAIIPSALVTLTVKLQVATVEDLRRDKDNGYELKDDGRDAEADEEDLKNNWWETKEPAPLVHAPYFPADRRATWWVYFGDVKQNRLITIGKVSDLSDEKTVRLQFQAPPRPGQWQFQVLVKSDSHLGCDALCELKVGTLQRLFVFLSEFPFNSCSIFLVGC